MTTKVDFIFLFRAYLSEFGKTVFQAASVVLLIGVAVEVWNSGLFFTSISPQSLFLVLLISGALMTLRPYPLRQSKTATVLIILQGILLSIATYIGVRDYFAVLGIPGIFLICATLVAIFLMHAMFRDFGRQKEGEE